ncbi:MAG: MFS transporter [Acetobacteraceae bacterium]|nr:MFS transporter [Acetobacteraceae bacterium]
MPEIADRALTTARLMVPLALANGVAVSSLYWGQAVVLRAGEEFGPSQAVSLMPGATLAGYAAGVAVLATLAGDLTGPRGMGRHFLLLALASCAAAASPTPVVLTFSCLVLGVGCALTQRLLATATSAVRPEHRARTIGWIIASGLLGIVIARSCVPAVAGWLGWRAVFWADAALASATGCAATSIATRAYRRSTASRVLPLPRAAALWRGQATLRRAALQQATVFAAFNMGWAIFPRVIEPIGVSPALSMAGVALLGATAALMAGRLCGSLGSPAVARAGVIAVGAATLTLILGLRIPPACYLGMALLDTGTQAALVANQARAQALASSPAMRGRLAAIVTTVGFIGGAVGSALGNLLASQLLAAAGH